jgi:hypothetical protein
MSTSHGLLDQVDAIMARAKRIPIDLPSGDGDNIQAQLVRYCCLLTCAAIEQALIDMAANYARTIGDRRLERYVSENLSTGKNPNPWYIVQTMSRFDPLWGDEIQKDIGTAGEDKIKSIVSNRNRFAHGQSVSMGVSSLSQWLPAAKSVCAAITRISSDAITAAKRGG